MCCSDRLNPPPLADVRHRRFVVFFALTLELILVRFEGRYALSYFLALEELISRFDHLRWFNNFCRLNLSQNFSPNGLCGSYPLRKRQHFLYQ